MVKTIDINGKPHSVQASGLCRIGGEAAPHWWWYYKVDDTDMIHASASSATDPVSGVERCSVYVQLRNGRNVAVHTGAIPRTPHAIQRACVEGLMEPIVRRYYEDD